MGQQPYGNAAFSELSMAVEIERRFLVISDGWMHHAVAAHDLRQGYLASSADGVTVRLRLRADGQAWLTLKASADPTGLVRHEFEYPIPMADAEALWTLAPHRLEKTRHSLDLPGGDWVVDCFAGRNAPLLLAEVELPSRDAPLSIPDWCGPELTGDPRWTNAVLAIQPVQSWTHAERQRFALA